MMCTDDVEKQFFFEGKKFTLQEVILLREICYLSEDTRDLIM